ncbi:MAG: gliding motility lipoprotein GldH [Bacteroidales bacterium]|nr:gliding motility lipoprotein GldH [Bacteroidales bacterium]
MGKPNIRTVIAFVVLATFFISCDRNVVFDEDRRVDEKGWHVSDALVFNYEATDTSNTFLCCIDLRNTIDYPFSNIYFSLKTIFPDGSVAADTNLHFILTEKDGRPLGRQNGRYIDGRYPFCYFHFPQQGVYQFVVEHAMRDTVLIGIKEVGISIVKIDN